MTSSAKPMPPNPPTATVSPLRINRTASRAVTILPVSPDRAVGTIVVALIDTLLPYQSRCLGALVPFINGV